MNAGKRGLINVVAVGVVVLLLTSLGLFWARCFCGTLRRQVLAEAAGPVALRPARALSGEGQDDPNVLSLSGVQAEMSALDPLLAGLGIMQYVQTRRPGGRCSQVYLWSTEPKDIRVYFDASPGQMVYQGQESFHRQDGTAGSRYVTLYIGPEGMSERPETRLGRFVRPLAGELATVPWLVYDDGPRRFFAIRPEQRTVTKGPQLPAGDAHRPVQIGVLSKNPLALRLGTVPGRPPQGADTGAPPREAGTRRLTAVARGFLRHPTYGVLVLDASGRIQLLDVETLQFAREVARLPKPATLFAPQGAVGPRDLAAYAVEPVAAFWRDGAQGEWSYTGCAVAALSADATIVRAEMFDPNGRTLAAGETEFVPYAQGEGRRSEPADPVHSAYFGVPGAATVTGLKFALESLHPPALLLLSYFTAPQFEATAGYRSVLLLPNSFVALKARDSRAGFLKRSADAGLLLLPSLVLAMLFAGLVARDGVTAGLTKNARTMWVAGALVFGLPVYITYRLTRPTMRMVTCRNCGQMRRPDQQACHGCGSAWEVPELTPPAWRVLDNDAEVEDRTPARAEPADSSAP